MVCSCLILFAACDKREPSVPRKTQPEKTLTIGLIPERHVFDQIERYKPLAIYLSNKIGVNIQLKVLPRYGNIIDNFISEHLDGAFFGSFTYALAHAKLGVEILVRPENAEGVSTYHGMIFARKDSGIRGIRDMKGKRFAFVDKATTAGYLLPLGYFSKHGVKNYKSYLKESYFTGTHEDAIEDVFNKKADIGAAKNTVFERISKENTAIAKELAILETSPEVPENGLAVRKDMDESLKKKLKETLLAMHTDPQGTKILSAFGTRRFIETTDDDYAPVLNYAKEIGLDLSTYDYMND